MEDTGPWYCFVCEKELDADNVYGPPDMDLCREHHELFYAAVEKLVEWSKAPAEQRKPTQLPLIFEVKS